MPTSCSALRNDIVLDHFASIPAEGGIDQPAVHAVLRMLDTGRVWLKLLRPDALHAVGYALCRR